jgi:hypothetical protein
MYVLLSYGRVDTQGLTTISSALPYVDHVGALCVLCVLCVRVGGRAVQLDHERGRATMPLDRSPATGNRSATGRPAADGGTSITLE